MEASASAAPGKLRVGATAAIGIERHGAASLGVDAGYRFTPLASVDVHAAYATERFDENCPQCFHLRAGIGPTVHGADDHGSVGFFAGAGWFFEQEPGLVAVPAPMPGEPAPTPRERPGTVDGAPEVGITFGSTYAIRERFSIGPAAEFAVWKDEDSPAITRLQIGLRGTLDFDPPVPARDPRRAIHLTAGIRAFVADPFGFGAEVAYGPLPWLELGVQTQWRHFDHGADGSTYCENCIFDDDRFSVFVEGRVVPESVVTPYARGLFGVSSVDAVECGARLPSGECERRSVDGGYPSVGGELGVELHGVGLSLRGFGVGSTILGLGQGSGVGGGLQLGARI